MENFDITSTKFVKYPPNSNLPKGLVNSQILKNNFLTKSASMMPKIEDFNQMFRDRANSMLNMNESIFPPGHPLYNHERSISALKEVNDKLVKENLELKKKLQTKTSTN